MALTVAGLDDEADRAYQWLVDTQLPDGSWFNYYLATGIEDARLDTNVCAYLATGAWHRYVSTGELDGLEQLWPAVEAGVDFVLRWQRPDGSIHWSLDPSGVPRGVRPAHRVVVDLPQPPVCHRLCRAPGPRAAGLGAGRRPAGPRAGPRTPRRSPPRSSSPWTGTTRSCPGPSAARRPAAASTASWDDLRAWRVAACAACPPASGSPRPRRPSACSPSTPWAWTTRRCACSAGPRPSGTRTAPTGRAWSTPRRPPTRRWSARPTRPGPWCWPPTPSAGPPRRRGSSGARDCPAISTSPSRLRSAPVEPAVRAPRPANGADLSPQPTAQASAHTRRSTRSDPHSPSSTNSPESSAARQMS